MDSEYKGGPCIECGNMPWDCGCAPIGYAEPKLSSNLRFEPNITQEMMAAEPDTLFVFGDNMARAGFGGQAKVMRGKPNAVGIPTKRAPRRDADAYFTDADLEAFRLAVQEDLARLKTHLSAGGTIVWPAAGIGTGLADLANRAPLINAEIQQFLADLRSM